MRIKKTESSDPAQQRYPQSLWPLLKLGKPGKKTRYSSQALKLSAHVPALIQMALDDDLNQREPDDPAVWSPLHALHILGELGPAEAIEPLLVCLDTDDDWLSEALPDVYASIGPAAIPALQTYLDDSAHDQWGRGRAAKSLAAIAGAHPETRDQVVAHLITFLDRPSADDSAEEEMITTLVICELGDLKASEAYPAIQRAYEQDRVNPKVVGLEDIERDFGMRPTLDSDQLPGPPEEPGVRLELHCKVCGRERDYFFPKVYYDLNTANDEEKSKRYNPIIIPQRVVCSKCGAVDQYEIAAGGYLEMMAGLLTQVSPELGHFRREDQRMEYMEFEAMGQRMHPLEAVERYQAELARHPEDAALHVGYGNVLKFLGRVEEAEVEYRRAGKLDPQNPHVYVNLAVIADERGDRETAIACWNKVLEVTPGSNLPRDEKRRFLKSARDGVAALEGRPVGDDFGPPERVETPPPTTPSPGPRRPKRKYRRNEPCWCGSGKKYKHCHMREDQKRR